MGTLGTVGLVRERLLGLPSTRVPLTIGGVLAVVASLGQTMVLLGPTDDPIGNGIVVILAINALLGTISVLRVDPFSNPGSTDRRIVEATNRGLANAFRVIAVAVVIQLVLGLAQAIVGGFIERWHDPTILAIPLLLAVLVAAGALCGFIVGLLVIWPVIKLVDALARRISGRDVVAGVVPLSVLLIATVVAAVFTVLAPHAETSGTPRGRGLAMLVSVWFIYSGDSQDQVFAWIARGLQIVIAASLVWLVLELRADKKRRSNTQ